ncbi:MAG: tRNA (N6-threonylcarbamoyladenosine(37)-N6)-methyltransferase TrmO [Desulfobacteraceae bacterium]|nr:tRNA (N6-threonylcarbamoyladenosine(37)-N6)-methyltransferase TrmO [Desulfobacteraceae bacterium]
MSFAFEPIGWISSCFQEKFGIPRQPGLVPEACACLEIIPPYDQREAFRGLESFSHLWILFVFHECYGLAWKATVRPPRLGGNRRVGVFASRSGFRPNPIGQSVVRLLSIERKKGRLLLTLGGIDLLNATPVLDIKPYLPYADAIPDATAGYAPEAPAPKPVVFSDQAEQACRQADPTAYPNLRTLIIGLLAQDPRPAYKHSNAEKHFGMHLWDLNVRFWADGDQIVVEHIGPAVK